MNNIENKKNFLLIKELRSITGAGFINCKKALIESKNDIKLAILNMRKSGQINAIKKFHNKTKNGIIITHKKNKDIAMIELNCQTDFVSQNKIFKDFGKEIASYVVKNKIINIKDVKKIFEEQKNVLICKFNENININRIVYFSTQQQIGSYIHNNMKIGVIVKIQQKEVNEYLIKQIAMHIAASNPECIFPEEINNEKILKEKQIYLDKALKLGKSNFIANKIAEGQIKKFKNSISLINQPFIFDTKKIVADVLKENNSIVKFFVRFEIGEK